MKKPIQKQKGFTLIELMITVAVIGILSAIAYPSYVAYVQRANRTEVKAILLQNASILERNFTMASRYDNTQLDGLGTATGGLIILKSPPGGTARYTILAAFSSVAPCTLGQCFKLSATPVGTMALDACGTYTLDHAGVQDVTGGSLSVAECWGR